MSQAIASQFVNVKVRAPIRHPEFLGHVSEFDTEPAHMSALGWWGGALLLVMLSSIAFSNVFGVGLLWNDHDRIANDMRLRSTIGLSYAWQHPFTSPDFPVAESLLYIEYQSFGIAHPIGYHAVSLLLHSIFCLLLWTTLGQIGLPLPGWIAAVYSVHPVAIDSAAMVGNQPLLLCLIFTLLALIPYLRVSGINRIDTDEENTSFFRLPSRGWILISISLFFVILAIASHPTAWIFPGATLAATMICFHRSPVNTRHLVGLGAVAVIGLAVTVITWLSHRTTGISISPAQNLLLLPSVVLLSVFHTFVPTSAPFDPVVSLGIYSCTALVFTALTVSLLIWYGRHFRSLKPMSFAGLFCLAALPSAFTIRSCDGESLLTSNAILLPTIVALAALGFVFHLLITRANLSARDMPAFLTSSRSARVAGIAVLTIFATLNWFHTAAFANESQMWQRASQAKPWSSSLGVAYARSLADSPQPIEASAADPLASAVAAYQSVLKDHPANQIAMVGLADCLGRQKKFGKAIDIYRHAVALNPTDSTLLDGESEMYAAMGISAQAIRLSERALELNPKDAAAQNDLALQLDISENLESAAAHYRAAIALDPLFCAPRINLATIEFRQANIAAAAADLVEVTHIDPRNFEAYANAGAMLAELKQWQRAEQLLRSAITINPNSRGPSRNLAVVLEAEGKNQESKFERQRAANLGE